jgi:hypothetical protein
MSDFHQITGFEDVWRPPIRPRAVRPQSVLGRIGAGEVARARLARIADRAPEVMVKVTGRTRDPAHLHAHLDYISRNGQFELEGRDGAYVVGREGVRDVAIGWAAEQLADPRTRADAPLSHSVVLSMPAGTDPFALRDAARAFAADLFAGSRDYLFTLHTDTPRPHVHLSICSRGDQGQRLNPKKADLEQWRQLFAEKLRERGVQAEATPRRARGVTRKAERGPVRRIRERHEAGQGAMGQVRQSALREASRAAFQGDTAPRAWEQRMADRQGKIRALYLAQAKLLQTSADARDQKLGCKVEAFVAAMPQPDSQRLALARELRAASRRSERERRPERDRSR